MSNENNIDEKLADIGESLKHAIHILTGILGDIELGEYTQEQAQADYENLMWNEGIDYMGAIQSYSLSQYA